MKKSAGLLVYRRNNGALEVFLAHPGGPLWAKKDLGAWSIPKGEPGNDDADDLACARREFTEEIGQSVEGDFFPLTPIKQKGRKSVHAWAVEAEVDAGKVVSNDFEMVWPPRSGHLQRFPEVDRGAWFGIEEAKAKINPAQAALIEELETLLKARHART
jgi:predicted NUDIX family NTP pyrophosphohydrolase